MYSNKNKLKKIIGSLSLIILMLLVVVSNNAITQKKVNSLLGNIALADDDEDEYDDYVAPAVTTQNVASPASTSSPKSTTQTVRLPDQIVTKTIIETVYEDDSDGDGLIDKEDPNPTIPEIYIVKDDNLNGIDDSYEVL